MKKTTVIQGEDRIIPIDIIRKNNATDVRRPFDITGWTKITVQFKKSNNSVLSIDTLPAHGRKASGVYGAVTYTAVNIGVAGNLITLDFDGVKTIAQVVSEWNAANPSNTVAHNSTAPTTVPASGELVLAGGLNNYVKVTSIDDIMGKIEVQLDNQDTNELKIGQSQSIKIIIDFGAHDLGNRRIAMVRNAFSVQQENL